jgi:hypothetical protein
LTADADRRVSNRPTLTEMRFVVEAACTALVARRVARLRPETMHRVLELRLPTARPSKLSEERVVHIVDWVLNRAPRRSRNPCLVRGITAYRLLRETGRDVDLVFGARMADDDLEAHCWLSDGVRAIYELDANDSAFGEMFRLTARGVEFAK